MVSIGIILDTAAQSVLMGGLGTAVGLGAHEGFHLLRMRFTKPRRETLIAPLEPSTIYTRFHRVPSTVTRSEARSTVTAP